MDKDIAEVLERLEKKIEDTHELVTLTILSCGDTINKCAETIENASRTIDLSMDAINLLTNEKPPFVN